MKKYLFLLFILAGSLSANAQNAAINNFLVKENLLKNDKIAVIAADSVDMPMEEINGTYTFSISGFTQELVFAGGVAVVPLPIEKSTFVYIKHKNDSGTHSKLVYVYKKAGTLFPVVLSTWWLILIPAILVILALAFRKFIIIAIVLF
ncbi:MAG: hypothetical protein EOP48_25415, partial [Sphingobacteriales bacterium]